MVAYSSAAEITLAGFIIVAIVAVGLMVFTRHDKSRSFRLGFFFEHEREPEPYEEEADSEAPTRIIRKEGDGGKG